WRFYGELPLHRFTDAAGETYQSEKCPYADFSWAFFTTLQNLTLQEMLTTVISLKRYELRFGKPSTSLNALVPEFLPALPTDFMDGRPLRYRLNSGSSFTLYSVGQD